MLTIVRASAIDHIVWSLCRLICHSDGCDSPVDLVCVCRRSSFAYPTPSFLMSSSAPRLPTAAEARRQIARDARRAAQAGWRALSPAQRCSADTVSTILSMFSLAEIARVSTVCSGWRAGAARVTRIHGYDGRVFNAAKKITAAEAASANAEAHRRHRQALGDAKGDEDHSTELTADIPPPLPVFAEDPLQVGSRLRSLLSSPLRRHIHTLHESMLDTSMPPPYRWGEAPLPDPSPRPFSFPTADRWCGSWSLAELRGLSALPHLTRLLHCSVQLRDFLFRSVVNAQFDFPHSLTEISLCFEWSEQLEPDLEASVSRSTQKAEQATCTSIMRALGGCSSLTSLSLQSTLPLQFDLLPLSAHPSLTILSVDCPVPLWVVRVHWAPALKEIALVELRLNLDEKESAEFRSELKINEWEADGHPAEKDFFHPHDLTNALFTRPHRLDGLRMLEIADVRFR